VKALTPLRGLAALAVLLCHAGVIAKGALGVDFFFILSGFVLMHAYGQMDTSLQAYLAFLKARLARIYPVHILVLVLLLMLPVWGQANFTFWGLVHSLLLTQSPWYSKCWNYVAWSVSAEWHAYLVFPFMATFIRSRSHSSLTAVLIACALVMSIVLGWAQVNQTQTPAVFLRLFPEFIAGMVLYRMQALVWFAGDSMFFGVVVTIVGAQILGLPDPVTVSLFPLLLLCSMKEDGLFGKILNLAPIRYLGEISYSVYMVQMFVQLVTLSLFRALFPSFPDWLANAFFVLSTILVAIPVSRFVEYPARAWLKNLAWHRVSLQISPVINTAAAQSH
jgi:peptidoglycan/LPS O-acetylase OafA/YrhL